MELKVNGIYKTDDGRTVRLLALDESGALMVNCENRGTPELLNPEKLTETAENPSAGFPLFGELNPEQQKACREKYFLIAPILPVIGNKRERTRITRKIAEERKVSKQTLRTYLWKYLVAGDLGVFCPPEKRETPMTPERKNMRWALNKYYYTSHQNSLREAYEYMLRSKYTDETGKLLKEHPSYRQFYYFYATHRKRENEIIKREGYTAYMRNSRPLLGNGVRDFASSVGYGMFDGTTADVYVCDNYGHVIGRPEILACVDGFSGMCLGYALSFNHTEDDLRILLSNINSDKVDFCSKRGVVITEGEWPSSGLPSKFITDNGKEYRGKMMENLTDLNIEVINLDSYRPDNKGPVEKFFDVIQSLYLPSMKGRGGMFTCENVPPMQYRDGACVPLDVFEQILIRCIVYYNNRTVKSFPYAEQLAKNGAKITPAGIFRWGNAQPGACMISVSNEYLALVGLPRCQGRFTRAGLLVNGLRYSADGFTEQYLNGGNATVAFDPNDVNTVWLYDRCGYTPFALIETQYQNCSLDAVNALRAEKNKILKAAAADDEAAKIELLRQIDNLCAASERRFR